MGCCQSCFEKDNPYEPIEPLPADGNSINPADYENSPFDTNGAEDRNMPHSEHDEQSVLSKIIANYNNEVIDITVLDTKLDAVEYMNRAQLYNRKVTAVTSGIRYKPPSLRSAGNNPASLLSLAPVNIDDVIMITELSGEARNAMHSVKVEKHGSLVVHLTCR